jgi:hypothetical protein
LRSLGILPPDVSLLLCILLLLLLGRISARRAEQLNLLPFPFMVSQVHDLKLEVSVLATVLATIGPRVFGAEAAAFTLLAYKLPIIFCSIRIYAIREFRALPSFVTRVTGACLAPVLLRAFPAILGGGGEAPLVFLGEVASSARVARVATAGMVRMMLGAPAELRVRLRFLAHATCACLVCLGACPTVLGGGGEAPEVVFGNVASCARVACDTATDAGFLV